MKLEMQKWFYGFAEARKIFTRGQLMMSCKLILRQRKKKSQNNNIGKILLPTDYSSLMNVQSHGTNE